MAGVSTRRRLRSDERDLLTTVLHGTYAGLLNDLNACTVEDMEDGVPVSIVLNTDSTGSLYEVDFWKVDFSPLLRYPRPSDLRIK